MTRVCLQHFYMASATGHCLLHSRFRWRYFSGVVDDNVKWRLRVAAGTFERAGSNSLVTCSVQANRLFFVRFAWPSHLNVLVRFPYGASIRKNPMLVPGGPIPGMEGLAQAFLA